MRRVALLLVLLPALSLALPEDSNQPIQIESNSAQRNERDNTLIYEGAVRIVQGSLNITADRVTVHFVDGEPERIVCEGTPAIYRQQRKAGAAPIDARARQIDYRLNDNLVILTGSARVEQEGSVLEGARITYDIEREQMQARGDDTDRRVRMVIPPKQQRESP